jgi:pimeloyl-ACP methyl ester carboxylesterase
VGEAQRRAAPGGFAALSDGVTHYQWFGPEGGRVIVMIHGLTTSSYVFGGIISELQIQGFRILTYDLYGRGLSDRPGKPQTRSFFICQLRELLQEQNVNGAVMLLGYSMGGSIATVFAAEEPERVSRLMLIAPAGLDRAPAPFAEFCRKMPWIGDWVHTVFGGLVLRDGQPAAASSVPDIAARQAAETRTRGYLRSVLSSRRNILAERLEEEHREVQRSGVPVLAIWGDADRSIRLTSLGELTRINRETRQVTVAGAGHSLAHSHPREVAGAIAAFIRET